MRLLLPFLLAVPLLALAAIAAIADAATRSHSNWQADGTYLIRTDDRASNRAYYRDVGHGAVMDLNAAKMAELQKGCRSIDEDWNALGFLDVARGDEPSLIGMCYSTEPAPHRQAWMSCRRMRMYLVDNRQERREVVCGTREHLRRERV